MKKPGMLAFKSAIAANVAMETENAWLQDIHISAKGVWNKLSKEKKWYSTIIVKDVLVNPQLINFNQ